jgi:hypothetical protein
MENNLAGELRLGHLFQVAGLAENDVMVIRHTLNTGGLETRAHAMGPNRLFTVHGETDPWNERHAAVRTALLKRITDL